MVDFTQAQYCNITYRWIPDIVEEELDFLLVVIRPRLCSVDESTEEFLIVSYHVEHQFPPEQCVLKTNSYSNDLGEVNLMLRCKSRQ